jgi:hypothetical protein
MVVRVDVRGLYVNQTLRVLGGRSQSFHEQLRHDVNHLSVQPGESLELLSQRSE